MTAKPVNLSIHKSQVERTRRKSMRARMVRTARAIGGGNDVVAYAIVTMDARGRASCDWDTGGAVPMWAFPSTVAEILKDDIQASGVDDDYLRPVLDRSWRGNQE